jgi:hypothetical protein
MSFRWQMLSEWLWKMWEHGLEWLKEELASRKSNGTRGMNSADSRGRNAESREKNDGKRATPAGKARQSKVNSWESRVSLGSPHEAATSPHQSCYSWAL